MTDPGNFSSCCFISLGANLPSIAGSARQTLAFAFDRIAELSAFPVLKSSLYSSSPVESPEGTPDFFNAIAGIIPDQAETPESLLRKLQEIENTAGRKRRGIKNEARTLDLDIILFKDEVRNTPALIIPHPRASERRFVLQPLLEITGAGFCFPGYDETLEQLLATVADGQKIHKLQRL